MRRYFEKFITISIILIILFIIYSDSQKKYFDEFSNWISFNTNGILIIVGAFATIGAVILTIYNEQKKRDFDKREEIEKKAMIVYFELLHYAYSIAELHKFAMSLRVCIGVSSDQEFQTKINKCMMIRNILFFSNNIKEYFYELQNCNKIDKKNIKVFINIFNSQFHLKSIFKDNILCNMNLILQESCKYVINPSVNELRSEVFGIFSSGAELDSDEEYNIFCEFSERIENLKEEDIIDDDFKLLLKYLKNIAKVDEESVC